MFDPTHHNGISIEKRIARKILPGEAADRKCSIASCPL